MFDLLIDALATWRLTSLFHHESGPFDIYGKFRDSIGIQYNVHNEPFGDNEVAKAFSCMWCLSVWFAFGVRCIGTKVRYALSLSAIAIMIERYIDG